VEDAEASSEFYL